MKIKSRFKQSKVIFFLIFLSMTCQAHAKNLFSYLNINQLDELKPKVLKLAMKAYDCANKKAIQKKIKSQLLTIIDYSLPSQIKRLWVIDLKNHKLLFHTWVSHGKLSGLNYPYHFSDKKNSYQSSLGLFLTGHAYQGKHGISLRLYGLESGINQNAFSRHIVFHSASYVNQSFINHYGYLGRSLGCLALNPQVTEMVINHIKEGSLVFIYYPQPFWLTHSTYLHCEFNHIRS